MTTFEVILHVSSKVLPHLLSTVAPECKLVSVKPITGETTVREPRYANGKRNKGISGRDLTLKLLGAEKRAFSYRELAEAVQSHGFAANSVSPVLSNLVKEKKVKALGNGQYALPGVKVP